MPKLVGPTAKSVSRTRPLDAVEPDIVLPPAHDWRTTDEDEVNRRRKRAREQSFVIRNADARFPVFSNFSVGSGSGMTYRVEIRNVAGRQFACNCQDFRKNGLGTCKHVEVVLLHLKARFKRLFARATSIKTRRLRNIVA